MADRLPALDASFRYLDDRSAPMHVGGVAVFRRPRSGFDHGQQLPEQHARNSMSDVDIVASMLEESVDELMTTRADT